MKRLFLSLCVMIALMITSSCKKEKVNDIVKSNVQTNPTGIALREHVDVFPNRWDGDTNGSICCDWCPSCICYIEVSRNIEVNGHNYAEGIYLNNMDNDETYFIEGSSVSSSSYNPDSQITTYNVSVSSEEAVVYEKLFSQVYDDLQ